MEENSKNLSGEIGKKKNPMKIKEIKDLIDYISKSGLEEVQIETEELSLKIKKSTELAQAVSVAAPSVAAAPAPAPAAPTTPAAAPATEESSKSKFVEVKSPMIGTFYRSPNPDAPPFINVGDTISKGQPVCIVEAMKLFNEIETEVSGKVVEILVENSQPVEFDQPLFLVDPS